MNNVICLYTDREAVLVAYLYDDLEPAERVAFDTHVTTCLPCRSELADMRGVRSRLAEWVPPEPSRLFSRQSSVVSHQSQSESRRWWHTVPVWAQVAAAMLVLGVSASIANLDIRYDKNNGLNVRTGWSKSAPAAAAVADAPADAAPWRAELAALRTELRLQMRAQSTTVSAAAVTAPVAGGAMSDAEFGRRMQVLLAESEKKQQKELAVRLVQLQTDFNALLQSDRIRTNQLFRDVTNTYGTQIQNQQRQINYLQPVQGR